MYKMMDKEQFGSNQEQLNDGGIDIDQLFEQIQTEIDTVDDDRNKSNNTQQIEQLGNSFNRLDQLVTQVQTTVEQQRIANKLREQFEQLRSKKTELEGLKSQIAQQSPITKLDPELYTISEADPGQGRDNAITSVKTVEAQGFFSSGARHFFQEILGLSA